MMANHYFATVFIRAARDTCRSFFCSYIFFVLIYFSPTTACQPTIATNKTGHNKRGCHKLQNATCDSPFNTQKKADPI